MNEGIKLAEKMFGPVRPSREPVILDEGSLFYKGNKKMSDQEKQKEWECQSCGKKMLTDQRLEVLPGVFKCYGCRGELNLIEKGESDATE